MVVGVCNGGCSFSQVAHDGDVSVGPEEDLNESLVPLTGSIVEGL